MPEELSMRETDGQREKTKAIKLTKRQCNKALINRRSRVEAIEQRERSEN